MSFGDYSALVGDPEDISLAWPPRKGCMLSVVPGQLPG